MEFTKANGARRVVVTGGGMVSALGRDWTSALQKLQSCTNCIRALPEWDFYRKMNTRLACPYDEPLPSYPRKKIRGMGRVALLSLVATEDALRDAGFLLENGDVIEELKNGRTGIAYGSCSGSLSGISTLFSFVKNGEVSGFDSQTYIKAMPQTCACNLSVCYQLRGRIIITDTACTSGSQAIGYAYEAISDGRQTVMVAGGAEELSVVSAYVFDTLGAASIKNTTPELTPRCFDKDRDGLVIGEGAGTLILEDLEHAVKRGAKIYAEVAGFATNADGTHITNPNAETQSQCMKMALENAGIDASEIAYINAHGTATRNGDISETDAVYRIFNRPVPISSTKSYIGHTLGACGAIESWLSINMMNEGWFHPNLNFTQADPACAPLDYITGKGRNINANYIMSNNFAFGGVNTSLIFKRWKE